MSVITEAVHKNGGCAIPALGKMSSGLWNKTRGRANHLVCKGEATRFTWGKSPEAVRTTTFMTPLLFCLLGEETSRADRRRTGVKPLRQYSFLNQLLKMRM
jgi:hypothetical protein